MKTKDEVITLLRGFFRNEEELNLWLDFPHPSLGERSPRAVMDEDGGADAVFTMFDNARKGLPS